MRVLQNLPYEATLIASKPCTLPKTSDLDLLLLKSSPLEPIKLIIMNKKFTKILHNNPIILSLVKRYMNCITYLYNL